MWSHAAIPREVLWIWIAHNEHSSMAVCSVVIKNVSLLCQCQCNVAEAFTIEIMQRIIESWCEFFIQLESRLNCCSWVFPVNRIYFLATHNDFPPKQENFFPNTACLKTIMLQLHLCKKKKKTALYYVLVLIHPSLQHFVLHLPQVNILFLQNMIRFLWNWWLDFPEIHSGYLWTPEGEFRCFCSPPDFYCSITIEPTFPCRQEYQSVPHRLPWNRLNRLIAFL